MREVSWARSWASRGAVVTAALACIATSQPRWHLAATFPAGAPTRTPAGGTQGLAVTVDASTVPSVGCTLSGNNYHDLKPLAPLTESPTSPVHTQYLCPPGGQLAEIRISGVAHGGLCADTKAPRDQFVGITKLEPVETWKISAEASFAIQPWEHDPNSGAVMLIVHSPQQPFLEATVEPGPDAAAFGTPFIMGPSVDGAHYDIVMSRVEDSKPHDGKLHVHATIYGVCAPACTPPPADTLTIELAHR